ncbi:hypothetical protein BHE74_00031509 [Ensete ventricosum]|nr:hypothetical protein BHE74_00031509 [Ensete ventricosum]
MWGFDPLPYRRGSPDTLKVAGGALHRDLGHDKASWPPLLFACQLLTEGSYSQHLILPWARGWGLCHLGHVMGPQEDFSIAPVVAGAHSSATAQMKEVRVLKLDLEGALAYDGEAEDLPSTGED